MIYKQMNNAPMPQNINDEFLSTTAKDGVQPQSIPSRIHMILHTLDVAPIIQDMQDLHIKYKQKDDSASFTSGGEPIGPDPTCILRINSHLDDYLDQIPQHLRADADLGSLNVSEEDRTIFRYQGQVARSRYAVHCSERVKLMSLQDLNRKTFSVPALAPGRGSTVDIVRSTTSPVLGS